MLPAVYMGEKNSPSYLVFLTQPRAHLHSASHIQSLAIILVHIVIKYSEITGKKQLNFHYHFLEILNQLFDSSTQ